MNLFRAISAKFAAELRDQILGRRALHEFHFAKYKVSPQQRDRTIAERLSRRLRKSVEIGPMGLTPTH